MGVQGPAPGCPRTGQPRYAAQSQFVDRHFGARFLEIYCAIKKLDLDWYLTRA